MLHDVALDGVEGDLFDEVLHSGPGDGVYLVEKVDEAEEQVRGLHMEPP